MQDSTQPPTVSLVKPTIVPQDFITLWRRNMITGHNMKSARKLAIAQFNEQFPDIVLDISLIPRNIADCISPDDAAKLTSNDAMILSLLDDETAFADFIVPQVENAGSIEAVIEALNLSKDTILQVHKTYRNIAGATSNDTKPTSKQPEKATSEAEECNEDDGSCISDEEVEQEEESEPVDKGAEKKAAMQQEYEHLTAKWLKKDGAFTAKASIKVRRRIVELRTLLNINV